jgi:hypothetical protein
MKKQNNPLPSAYLCAKQVGKEKTLLQVTTNQRQAASLPPDLSRRSFSEFGSPQGKGG